MLLEIIMPEGVTLPKPVEVFAGRIVQTEPGGIGFEVTKNRSPGAGPTVTLQLHRRLEFDEWKALAAMLSASVTQAEEAIARLPAPPEKDGAPPMPADGSQVPLTRLDG